MNPLIKDRASAMAAYDALDDGDKALVQQRTKAGIDPVQAVNSLVMQRAAQGSDNSPDVPDHGATTGEKIASYAEGTASNLGLGLAPLTMGLGSAVNAPTNSPAGMVAAFKSGYSKQRGTQADADAQAPAAAGAGHLTGDFVNAALGLAGPVSSGVSTGRALLNGAKPADVLSTGLAPILESPLALRAKAALGKATSDVGEAGPSTLHGNIWGSLRTILGAGGEVKPNAIVEAADDLPEWVMPVNDAAATGAVIRPPLPVDAPGGVPIKFTADAPPELTVEDIAGHIKAFPTTPAPVGGRPIKFTPAVDDADLESLVEARLPARAPPNSKAGNTPDWHFRPAGEMPVPSPQADAHAESLSSLEDLTKPPPASEAGQAGGVPEEDLRSAALAQALAEAHRPQWELDAVAAFKNAAGNPDQYRAVSEWLTQNGVDLGTQARLGEEAGTIDSSLELPMRRPRAIDVSSAPKPTSADELKAEVAAAVQRGEPLKALAERLGVNQGDLNAWYKSAQVGNLGVRPPGILRFTSDGTPIDEELESQIAMERARAPDAPADTEDFRLPPIEPPPPAFQDTRPMVRWTTSRAPAQLLPQNWVANDSDLRLSMTDQVWRTQQADRAAEAELAAERARAAAESGGTNPGRAGARRGVDGPASTGRMLSRGELRQMIRDFTKDGSDVDVEKLVDEIIRSRGGK